MPTRDDMYENAPHGRTGGIEDMDVKSGDLSHPERYVLAALMCSGLGLSRPCLLIGNVMRFIRPLLDI